MTKKFKMIFIVLILFNLCSCYDYLDIDKKTIITAVGVDKIEDKYKFIAEYPQIRSVKLSENNVSNIKGKETALISGSGKNFDEARKDIDNKLPFPAFLGAVKAVILSKDIAKDDIMPYLNRINNIYDYRKTVLIVLSREPAEDILNLKPKNDASIGFMIDNLINQLSSSGYAKYVTSGEIIQNLNSEYSCGFLPYIGIEDNSVKYIGIAVFKKGKYVGYININECQAVNYIISKKPKGVITIKSMKNNKNIISIESSLSKKSIKTKYENRKIVIDINLKLKSQLLYEYYIEPIDEKFKQTLEKEISNEIKKQLLCAIKKSQEDFNADFFNFYKYFRTQNFKTFKEINYDEEYKNAIINVNVENKIIGLGLIDVNAKKNISR